MSLLEALVALALLAVALLAGLALYAQQRRVEQRLAAQHDADRAAASLLEAVRAGMVPLASGEIDAEPFTGSAALALALEVEGDAAPGLWRVRAIATYTITGQSFRRSIETLVWRP
jgi:Tfp pilus assembly protein PilV